MRTEAAASSSSIAGSKQQQTAAGVGGKRGEGEGVFFQQVQTKVQFSLNFCVEKIQKNNKIIKTIFKKIKGGAWDGFGPVCEQNATRRFRSIALVKEKTANRSRDLFGAPLEHNSKLLSFSPLHGELGQTLLGSRRGTWVPSGKMSRAPPAWP